MKLKVALIAPPYPLEEAPSPPLGICYVASAFIKAGAKVKIYDFIVSEYSREKLSKELLSFTPDIIGTTSVTMNFSSAIDILSDAREIMPEATTIMGGPHVSFDWNNVLKNHPYLDLIFRGEADETIKDFAESYGDKEKLRSVKGLVLRDNGKIVDTGKRDFVEDLDSIGFPARDLLPVSKYKALGFPVSMITSRGCPGRCIFCLGRKMTGQRVRKRSVEKVVDEIETILMLGFEFINIADDLFTADKNRVIKICDEIKRRNLKFSFSVFSRVNTIDYELLLVMKSAGLHAISFGIESGNKEMLKRVRKGITLKQAKDAIAACKKAGVRSHVSFMVGLPGEDDESLEDTLKFQKELETEFGYHLLSPFPGTTIRENVDQYDLEILTDNWKLYDAKNPVVKTNALDQNYLRNFVTDAYSKINLDWEKLLEKFSRNDVTDEEEMKVAGHNRMNLIFAILSSDLVEKNRDITISDLSHRISDITNFDRSFVTSTLESLVSMGLMENNSSTLSWVQ